MRTKGINEARKEMEVGPYHFPIYILTGMQ
jgi:hypothetical protein